MKNAFLVVFIVGIFFSHLQIYILHFTFGCLTSVSWMRSSKFLVKDSIFLSCIQRFVTLIWLVVVLLTMWGKFVAPNKQIRLTNLWKLLKEILLLIRNFNFFFGLTAAKQSIRKWEKRNVSFWCYSGISVLRTTLKQAITHPKRSFILFNP